jgi:hypothetical protein
VRGEGKRKRREERGSEVERLGRMAVTVVVSATGSIVSLSLSYVFRRFRIKYSGIAIEQLGSINSQRKVVREGETETETKTH